MTNSNRVSLREAIQWGLLAGLAGGLAEVAWIWLYGVVSGTDPELVAWGVSVAAGVGDTAAPLTTGVAIHMALAAALGIALTVALRPLFTHFRGNLGLYASVIAALVAVWAVNFFAVLPRLSPAFLELLPYQVGLLSKILFGLAAARVLGAFRMRIRPLAIKD
jgi:hypothetical protein